MAEDSTGNEDTVKVGKGDKKPGKGGLFKKYKWWIIGGSVALVLLIVYFMHSQSGANAAAAQSATDPNASGASAIDPATGYMEGTPADLAALGGSSSQSGLPGPAGSAGATGATGAKGAPGKPEDLWQISINILKGRGIKNPTRSQIWHVRQSIEQIGTKAKPKPVAPTKLKPKPVKK